MDGVDKRVIASFLVSGNPLLSVSLTRITLYTRWCLFFSAQPVTGRHHSAQQTTTWIDILYSVQICRWTDRQPRQGSVLMWYQMDRGGWIEIWKSINPSTSFRCWLTDWLCPPPPPFDGGGCNMARPSLSSLHFVIDGEEGKVCKSP